MEYTMKAKQTVYKGIEFDSRLEAKWACFFDLCKWRWSYHPVDFSGWYPDFALYPDKDHGIYGVPIYVEVKPIMDFDSDVGKRIASRCGNVLLLGDGPFVNPIDGHVCFGCNSERAFGYYNDDDYWENALFSIGIGKEKGDFIYDFEADTQIYGGRMNGLCLMEGSYQRDDYNSYSSSLKLEEVWAEAVNIIKYRHGK